MPHTFFANRTSLNKAIDDILSRNATYFDKDNNPKWKFNSIEKVSQDWINQHTESAWETNPLEDL